MDFLRFIELSNQCATRKELVDLLEKALEKFGFEKFNYGLANGADVSKNIAFMALGKNYPTDWIKYYFENGYQHDDIRLAFALKNAKLYVWEELKNTPAFTDRARLILNQAEDAGLKSGIGVSIHEQDGNIFNFNFASQLPDIQLNSNQKAELHAVANQFHYAYNAIEGELKFVPLGLSPRQKEVLTWMASGKSTSVISSIMNISESTVDYHSRHIFKKLDCNSRVVAVTKAIRQGLINV